MQQDHKSTARPAQNEIGDNFEVPDNRPLPNDFFNFFPWACNQFQLESVLLITKVTQHEYISVSHGDKVKKTKSMMRTASRRDVSSMSEGKEEKSDGLPQALHPHKVIRLTAYCDVHGNIVELKFDKNKYLPCLIFKIMALIIKYQIYLTRITINSGMDMRTLYEMNKFLYLTNITELCLDNSFFPEANYDILFGDKTKIRYLSLARCEIDNAVVENIAKKLTYPSAASKCLTVLILASNRITDKGIIPLAQALRCNRQLSYISLADNGLTDDGVFFLLDTLIEFPLTNEEVIEARGRHMRFLKDKNEMIISMMKELRAGEFDKKTAKKKTGRPATPVSSAPKKGKLEKDNSMKSLSDSKSNPNLDYQFHDKAVSLVEEKLGEFSDPFSSLNTLLKNGMTFCYGNNAVSYLNLAYNNISFLSLKKLLSVLMYQKLFDRKPRGLVNICLEGNNLPVSCKELSQIEEILTAGLASTDRRTSMMKKKATSRNTPR